MMDDSAQSLATGPAFVSDSTQDDVIDLRDPHRTIKPQPTGVPFVDLVSEYGALRAEIDAAIQDVLDRGDFVLGQATVDFEDEFALYCQASFAVGTDSGFSGIELMLRAHGLGPGDEIITAANTFYSTVRPIEACGATPVLVDADPASRNLDVDQVEAAITARTRAILPVHLYGHTADMAAINKIAAERDLLVFEDACQAHGATYRGSPVGGLGHAAAFSFYPSKNLGAFGDAGIVVTNSADVDQKIRNLRNLGSTVKYKHEGDGFNRRLDTIQAAVLRVKLRYLDEANRSRVEAAGWYREALEGLDVRLPSTAAYCEPVYHLYVIESPHRDDLARGLGELGVQTGVHYPAPIHMLPAFESLGYREGQFPVAERLSAEILSLPMHPNLSADDVLYVAESLQKCMDTVATAL